MAGRYEKTSFDFFRFYTDFFNDSKIKALKRAYGTVGLMTYIWLLNAVYSTNGYYYEFSSIEELSYDIAEAIASDNLKRIATQVTEIIPYLAKVKLIDTQSVAKSWISGKTIQAQYVELCKSTRRKFDKSKLFLLDNAYFEERKKSISSEEIGISSEEIGISSEEMNAKYNLNKIKEKEINLLKEKDISSEEIQPPFDSALIAKAKELAKGKGNEEAYALAVLNDWRKRGIEKLSDFPQTKTGKKIDFAISTREYTKEELDGFMQDGFNDLDELLKGDNENDERRTTRA